MSKLTRVLALGTMLAAVNIAGMTTVAHATDHAAITQDGRRPPAERQVGEAWRHDHVTADQRTLAGTPQPPLERQVGEAWRHPQVAAEQPTVANDTRRPPTEAQVGETWRHPTSAPVPTAEPSGQPSWLLPSLGVLAAALVLAGGLAVLAARRAGRRARLRHAA
jgi:hypothetical protein